MIFCQLANATTQAVAMLTTTAVTVGVKGGSYVICYAKKNGKAKTTSKYITFYYKLNLNNTTDKFAVFHLIS